MEIENPKKSPTIYECSLCDYITINKKDYKKHVSTRKHAVSVSGNRMEIIKIPIR